MTRLDDMPAVVVTRLRTDRVIVDRTQLEAAVEYAAQRTADEAFLLGVQCGIAAFCRHLVAAGELGSRVRLERRPGGEESS